MRQTGISNRGNNTNIPDPTPQITILQTELLALKDQLLSTQQVTNNNTTYVVDVLQQISYAMQAVQLLQNNMKLLQDAVGFMITTEKFSGITQNTPTPITLTLAHNTLPTYDLAIYVDTMKLIAQNEITHTYGTDTVSFVCDQNIAATDVIEVMYAYGSNVMLMGDLTGTKPEVTVQFNELVNNATVTFNLNGKPITFKARTTPSLATEFQIGADNNASIQNFNTVLNTYLTTNVLDKFYQTTTNANELTLKSLRTGSAYNFNGNTLNVNKIIGVPYMNNGTYPGLHVYNSGSIFTAQENNVTLVVACYPSGAPDCFEILVNGTKKATSCRYNKQINNPLLSSNYGYPNEGDFMDSVHFYGHDLIENMTVPSISDRMTDFETDNNIKGISFPKSLYIAPHNGYQLQVMWAKANLGDTFEIDVTGGSYGGTGFTFMTYQVSAQKSDIQIINFVNA